MSDLEHLTDEERRALVAAHLIDPVAVECVTVFASAINAARAEVARLREERDRLDEECCRMRAGRDAMGEDADGFRMRAEAAENDLDRADALLREIVAWWDRIDAGDRAWLDRNTEDRVRAHLAALTADDGGDEPLDSADDRP